MEADTKVKTVKQLPGSVATFKRQRDNVRIYVYPRSGESTENAIKRVKSHNGSGDVVHQTF
jgi:hypothetical protein